MIRKLLLAILCVTLCSCGASHKALENENAQSDIYSLKDKISMLNSTWEGFSMRRMTIHLAQQDSLMKSPKKLRRRGFIESFGEIYEKEFSAEIAVWEREQGQNVKRNVKGGNWRKAILYIIHQQKDDLNIDEELRAFGKKWKKAELKTNYEYMKGVALAKSIAAISREASTRPDEEWSLDHIKRRVNAIKKYLDLISENPLSELSEVGHYGYWISRPRFLL